MSFLFRWFKRLILLALIAIIGLMTPVIYVETACRGTPVADTHIPILAEADRRAESRTLLTYPEWHIVHAYDDYAAVIAAGDPHDFYFLSSITGFWTSLCALSQTAASHGGVPWETKQMVYTIGVSFSAELLLKAAYEETIGRVATLIRGGTRAPLDDLSAKQAGDYATFLQQVPWYKWDFMADAAALDQGATTAPRDIERRLALGLEFRAKAAYAKLIEVAVAGVGADQLTMRVIVSDIEPDALAQIAGIQVITVRPEGTEIETPRYRAFTDLARQLAGQGANFVEIAGNDDILYTAITDGADDLGALHRFARQGNAGYRHLMLIKVADLADVLRLDGAKARLEHIHDY